MPYLCYCFRRENIEYFHYQEEDRSDNDAGYCLYTEEVRLNHKWSSSYDLEMETFLRNIPKIELHVHLSGSFHPTLLYEHVRKEGYNFLPEKVVFPFDQTTMNVRSLVGACKDLESFKSLCICRGNRSLISMLKCFEIFIPIVRGNIKLIEDMAFDFVKRQAKQNVIYTEVRYSPHSLSKGGGGGDDDVGYNWNGSTKTTIDARPVLDAVTRGLRRGEKEYGVKVNQILCCMAWKPHWAQDVIKLANERKNDEPCAIVGVDIAAGEDHFDEVKHPELYQPHYKAFRKAQDLGLNITIHAGEVSGAQSVLKAVNEYGAKRIGHGYRIASDPTVMDEMKVKDIHFEACPTSSLETGGWEYNEELGKDWKAHPSKSMFQHGLSIGLNSDDPAVFDTSLTWQYRVAVGKMGLDKDFIIKSLHDSINASFISHEEKDNLRAKVYTYTSN